MVDYVSCTPSTLAKDNAVLDPEYMQPVDKFSQTAHVEMVSELVLSSKAGS
jgi:23S rRNA (uracil1939-C5)-methyltransferase